MKTRFDGMKHLADFNWNRYELLKIVVVLVGLGWLAWYNFSLAQGKARDWERKEQVKRMYKALADDYVADFSVFPPSTDTWEIRGCGDQVCPTEDHTGSICQWGSDRPAITLACEDYTYFSIAAVPDNPSTRGPDSIQYHRITPEKVVFEVCLEESSDPEAQSIDKSLTKWPKGSCPSGALFIWPAGTAEGV